MTKRRPSIRGRGEEILFGEPSPVEIEPRSLDVALAEDAAPDTVSWLDDEELERALYEEAQDGVASLDDEDEPAPVVIAEPPTPEMERAFFEEDVPAEEPPEPVEETPTPTPEVTMEETELSEEAALYEPPPPETSDAASSVLPARSAKPSFELGEDEDLSLADIQAPGEQIEPLELPDRALTEEEQEKLLARLGRARIQQLDADITRTYDAVLSKVGEHQDIVTECHNQLLQARDIVLRRDAGKISQAEYYIEQVRARLKRAAESEAGAKKYAWWIALWGMVWFVAYTAVLIMLNFEWFRNVTIPVTTSSSPVDMEIFLPAMVWGGIGGVAAVFYSLFKHVGRRDFDSQYNLSYVGKPFLGIILGATVYMIVHLMIMTLGILPAGVRQGTGDLATPTVAPWIIYLIAWACGFKENRIFDLVDRVMKRIFSGGAET
jgi:hypothetical protein